MSAELHLGEGQERDLFLYRGATLWGVKRHILASYDEKSKNRFADRSPTLRNRGDGSFHVEESTNGTRYAVGRRILHMVGHGGAATFTRYLGPRSNYSLLDLQASKPRRQEMNRNVHGMALVEPGIVEGYQLPSLFVVHGQQEDANRDGIFAERGLGIEAYATTSLRRFGEPLECIIPNSEALLVVDSVRALEQNRVLGSGGLVEALQERGLRSEVIMQRVTDPTFNKIIYSQALNTIHWADVYFPGIPAYKVIQMIYNTVVQFSPGGFVFGAKEGLLSSYGQDNDGGPITRRMLLTDAERSALNNFPKVA